MKFVFNKLLQALMLVCVSLGSAGIGNALAETLSKEPSKIAYAVQLEIERCAVTASSGVTDFSSLAEAAVRVSEPGEIELIFHAATAIGPQEVQDLEDLGVTRVTELKIPPELGYIGTLVLNHFTCRLGLRQPRR